MIVGAFSAGIILLCAWFVAMNQDNKKDLGISFLKHPDPRTRSPSRPDCSR